MSKNKQQRSKNILFQLRSKKKRIFEQYGVILTPSALKSAHKVLSSSPVINYGHIITEIQKNSSDIIRGLLETNRLRRGETIGVGEVSDLISHISNSRNCCIR